MGSDGKFAFWDKDARTKLKGSEQLDLPISACAINPAGTIFAYAASYDWSKVSDQSQFRLISLVRFQGHEYYSSQHKNRILLRNFGDEMKPRGKNSR